MNNPIQPLSPRRSTAPTTLLMTITNDNDRMTMPSTDEIVSVQHQITMQDQILVMQETTNHGIIVASNKLNILVTHCITETEMTRHSIEHLEEEISRRHNEMKRIRSMAGATAGSCITVSLGNTAANSDLGEDVSEQGPVLVSEKAEDNLFDLLTTGRDNLGSQIISERRRAVASLLKCLPATHQGLEALKAKFSRESVSVLYRSILQEALKYSKDLLESNQKITDERKQFLDLSFPRTVFLLMDIDVKLECNDGGYNINNAGMEEDWKTRSRHGHHVDVACVRSESSKSSPPNSKDHVGFNATRYVPHVCSNDDQGSQLSYMDVAACVLRTGYFGTYFRYLSKSIVICSISFSNQLHFIVTKYIFSSSAKRSFEVV
jgi:hypothetical protein